MHLPPRIASSSVVGNFGIGKVSGVDARGDLGFNLRRRGLPMFLIPGMDDTQCDRFRASRTSPKKLSPEIGLWKTPLTPQ
jgi:hypothetical protein